MLQDDPVILFLFITLLHFSCCEKSHVLTFSVYWKLRVIFMLKHWCCSHVDKIFIFYLGVCYFNHCCISSCCSVSVCEKLTVLSYLKDFHVLFILIIRIISLLLECFPCWLSDKRTFILVSTFISMLSSFPCYYKTNVFSFLVKRFILRAIRFSMLFEDRQMYFHFVNL